MIYKDRVKGSLNNLIDSKYSDLSVGDRFDRGALEGVAYDVANAAILVYREKIAAGLRRAGLDVADTDDLTVDTVLAAVKAKTGVDLRSFDVDEIKDVALRELSTDISERLGFDIDLRDGLEAALDGAVEAAIAKGGSVVARAGQKVALRRLALAEKAGVSVLDVRRVQNARRQREWRKSAPPMIWVSR
jgi:uncharacterized NAD-dependent epimerase/dehydratase family protein